MSTMLKVCTVFATYGWLGDNLPSHADVVQVYKSHNNHAMRIYSPEHGALAALRRSDIGLILDVGGVDTGLILPAMRNVHAALAAAALSSVVRVSTALKMDVFANTFPPSSGVFHPEVERHMVPVARFLADNRSPLPANVYPYFAYRGSPGDISLGYATFQTGTTVRDSGNGLVYTNLFDAMVGAIYAALEKAGAPGVRVVVSESGWPSAGGFATSVDNARRYNQGLMPKRPGVLETYVFAMFDENQKLGDATERELVCEQPGFSAQDPSPYF